MININKHENCGNESKRKRNYEILLVLSILCFTLINVSANYDQYVIKWVVPSAPASNITVSVSPTSVPANGFNFATITLQAVSGSNPISNNSWVNLSVNSSTAKFSTSGTNTTFVKLNNTGGYSLLLNNTVVETVRINATNTTYGWVNNTQTVDFTSYPRTNIISWNPVEKTISNIEGESRTFSISINQTVNVSWDINGTEVFNQSCVNFSECVSTGVIAGTWNVTAIASNENGTDMQTWDWFVSEMPGGGGGGARSMDSDGDGYTDIQEMLAGTDENDPCDPNPGCPACLAIRPPAPTPSPTPTETPTLAPTITPSPTPVQTPSSTIPPTTDDQKQTLMWVIGLMAVSIMGILIYTAFKLRKK
jgi:hypothetical protein